MSENPRNIHRHKTGGITFASTLLIIIAIISMIITFTSLKKDEKAPIPDSEAGDTATNEGSSGDNQNTGNENGNGDTTQSGENQNTPPKNTTVTLASSDIYKGALIQVDEDHPYNVPADSIIAPSEMEKLDPGYVKNKYNFINLSYRHDGYFKPRLLRLFLNSDAADAFCAMMKAYNEETGISYIQLTYAYVNKGVYDIKSTGLTVDLNIYDGGKTYPLKSLYSKYNTPQHYEWFKNNCYKYGFVHVKDGTGSDNFSTFRYVGVPHATYMSTNYLSLEEYIEFIKTKTADDRLVTLDANGNEWWTYYVPASSGETTEVKVFGSQYTISGDNAGGFIVSVNTAGIK